jgi:hypothetical protein
MVTTIVSRYNEDLLWLDGIFTNVVIYNKGSALDEQALSLKEGRELYQLKVYHLENIGREAHTYLHHIVNNYNNLATWNIFLQGNPFDHCPEVIRLVNDFPQCAGELNKFSEGCYSLANRILKEDQSFLSGLGVYAEDLHYKTFNSSKQYFVYASGAQYIVHKQNILNRPREFYMDLLNSYNWNTHMPWSIERIWPEIFNIDY